MSDDTEELMIEQTGGPATNLRKHSSKINVTDMNMAAMGDKIMNTPQQQQQQLNSGMNTGGKKTSRRVKKINNTPSVKGWLTTEGATGEEGIDDEYGGEWSMTRQGQRQNKMVYGESWGPTETNPPLVEDWTEDERHTASDSDAEVVLKNNKPFKKKAINGKSAKEAELEAQLEIDIDNLDDDQMRELLKVLCETVRNLVTKINASDNKVAACEKKVLDLDDKTKLTTKAVIRHDKDISNNAKSVNRLQLSAMKSCLLISGIKEEKGEKCDTKVQNFFKELLKINTEIPIVIAHRLGRIKDNGYRLMKVTLADSKDKGIVYKHSKNLKGVTNDKGENYYINDQLPDIQTELQRKHKDRIKVNKSLISAQQQSMEWKRGELHVDGIEFKSKVKEPTCAEILEMGQQQLRKIFSVRLHQGDSFTKDGSSFIGFAMKAHSTQEVLLGYQQLKYRFLEATHLMCAHRIMDPDVAHMTDSVDGGEIGAGRRMVKYLTENSCENVAAFVVRHHRGPNIGTVRFDMIESAVKSAIDNMPPDLGKLMNMEQNANAAFSTYSNPIGQGGYMQSERGARGGSVRGQGYPRRTVQSNEARAKGALSAARTLFPDGGSLTRKHQIQSIEV